jgi:hypothetical protein
MAWLIGFIPGAFVTFVEWLLKKVGISKAVLLLIAPIFVAYIGFMLAAVAFIISYILNVWNTFRSVMNTMFDYSAVTGSYGGIANSQIVASAFAFLHECGLADALLNAGTLFIGLLSAYFTIQLYKVIMAIIGNMTKIITDMLLLLNR